MTSATSVAALLTALACGLVGLLVPTLIARLPEPEPDPEPVTPPEVEASGASGAAEAGVPPVPEEPKIPYATLAGAPGLRVNAALLSALLGLVLGAVWGPVWSLLVMAPLVPVGVALAFIDWRTRLLPKAVIAPLYAVVVVCVVVASVLGESSGGGVAGRLVGAALGWLVIGGLYAILWFVYPAGMGYGDVRLAGVLGIALGYLGATAAYWGLLTGFLLGGVAGLVLGLLKVVRRDGSPFGPWMLLGAWVGMIIAGLGAG